MIIKKDEGIVLTSKGLEQLHYQIEDLANVQKLLNFLENTHTLEEIIPFILSQKINPKSVEYLVNKGYVEVIPLAFVEEVKLAHKEQFSMSQNEQAQSGEEIAGNEFNDDAFSKGGENLNKILDGFDPKNITVLNDKNTLHQKSLAMTKTNGSSYVDFDSLSALSPEKRGFDEIKELLKITLKQAFPIKSLIFNMKIKKITNMKGLNEFLEEVVQEIEKKQGKEIVEELISRINTIKYNNNLE